jgi:hypothetical protein
MYRVMNAVLPRFPELKFIMPHLAAQRHLFGRMMAFSKPRATPIPPDMRGS